jgi:2-polyprenyl-3-methyl-5-hydroxy-6-metoxy-1,4-benzoquinol methylase
VSAHLNHRQQGYNLLNGHGLEIGAFHQPAIIPAHCTIEYCDAQSKEESAISFPEVNIDEMVEVDYISDLDKEGLSLFDAEHFDFVILNHVIEHVANPIKVVEELFRITKSGGYVVISAPDKNFIFDKNRTLTSFAHLKEEYENNVTEVTDAHYIDFLQGVHPELLKLSPEKLQFHINSVKNRREHAHVWDSNTFGDFMLSAIILLKLKAICEFINIANDNKLEYFSVWNKLTTLPNDKKTLCPLHHDDSHLIHRKNGYGLLSGHGLEMGAFHQPAAVPWHCTVEYLDIYPKKQAIQYFPEVNIEDVVEVHHISDLDKKGLSLFVSENFDFVILNHVIEHIANPINVIKEVFRVIKRGGYVVISAPDKEFTFDKDLDLTPFSNLKEKYDKNVTEVTDTDYINIIKTRHPQISEEELQVRLNKKRNRRAHVHFWNSQSFSEFMNHALELLQIKATCVFVNFGDSNQLEYFSVWKKSR